MEGYFVKHSHIHKQAHIKKYKLNLVPLMAFHGKCEKKKTILSYLVSIDRTLCSQSSPP